LFYLHLKNILSSSPPISPFWEDKEGLSFSFKNPLPGEGEGAQNTFKLRQKKGRNGSSLF
jgi:hypothetical protein